MNESNPLGKWLGAFAFLTLLMTAGAHAQAPFGGETIISSGTNGGAWSVFAVDVDGDGDIDVLSAYQIED